MKIAIIGAGPRGLSVAERLCARHETLTLYLIDPFGIGGIVWQKEQSPYFLMNTISQQVTLFTDSSCQLDGPIIDGPHLYQWLQETESHTLPKTLQAAARQLTADEPAPRALYGVYQEWFFQKLQQRYPQVTFHVLKDTVTDIRQSQPVVLELASNEPLTVDAAILTLGHSPNEFKAEEQAFFALNKTTPVYFPAQVPTQVDLQTIQKTDIVILRGLGLSFFDYLSLLTQGRGGLFAWQAGQLHYLPSGEDPLILASSRSGLPYHVRGDNQKRYGESYQPVFFTKKTLQNLSAPVPYTKLWKLLQIEIEACYYWTAHCQKVPLAAGSRTAFYQHYQDSRQQPEQFKQAYQLTLPTWSWDNVLEPVKATDLADFQAQLQTFLLQDAREARKGNLNGPLASALDALKDLRDEVRLMITLLSEEERSQCFLGEFVGINASLSIGPPSHKGLELAALQAAGVVTFTGPDMQVTHDGDAFVVTSTYPETFRGTKLVEARLPGIQADKSLNPLTQALLNRGFARLHQLADTATGALAIDADGRLLAADGQPQPTLFLAGIPTEGYHFLTALSPRPGVNEQFFQETDRIAQRVLA
ncbi:hypothetical protein RU97_GL002229 [Enterococcus canis]|uniref:FAD-dependent urate hydroxylase HpyO/Asp monooxygenase CreE-like FAD/NAD(P)-binding domain-containing protein n=1 Tax=Enterococcus canis TaxID=214095 RepID=A0A1L8REF5_9ENTE|nr:FAD/NAD(P)-binding domain-containing protein [Enterococcus canis]OJG18156.1 hypothetical protein RU97_GL002229 [Enterococcus canis]